MEGKHVLKTKKKVRGLLDSNVHYDEVQDGLFSGANWKISDDTKQLIRDGGIPEPDYDLRLETDFMDLESPKRRLKVVK